MGCSTGRSAGLAPFRLGLSVLLRCKGANQNNAPGTHKANRERNSPHYPGFNLARMVERRMSALGLKRTYAVQRAMSALPPIATAKADIHLRLARNNSTDLVIYAPVHARARVRTGESPRIDYCCGASRRSLRPTSTGALVERARFPSGYSRRHPQG